MRWRILIFLFPILFIQGCGDSDVPLFSLEYQVDIVIPPGLNTIDTHVFTVTDVLARFEEFASITGANPDSVGRVLPNRADLISFVQNINYDFVSRISVWMISAQTPGLEKELFFLDFVEFNEDNDIMMLSSIANVRDIVSQDRFDIEVRLNFRTFSPQEVDSRLVFNLSAFN